VTDLGSVIGWALHCDNEQNRILVTGSPCGRRGHTGKRLVISRRVGPVGFVPAIVHVFGTRDRDHVVASQSVACQFKCEALSAVSRRFSVDSDFCTQPVWTTPWQ
jgi:hypothetical protein